VIGYKNADVFVIISNRDTMGKKKRGMRDEEKGERKMR